MTAKERGATPCEVTPHGTTAQADITTPAPEVEVPRGAYHPLTWRGTEVQQQDADQAQQTPTEKTPDPLLGWHQLGDPARKAQKLPRGKHRRNARREAVASKRHQAGGATLDAMCLAAGVFWLATVCAWLLVEVLK
jgi:hypothetical protein